MAGQSKMQFLDLDHELIVLIISKTTLLHQFTHRRVSKNFKKIIEDYVWLNCKRLSEKDFPGTYYLPMDQICQLMLPKMPHLKKLPLRYSRKSGKNESIIDLASRYCHEINFFGDSTSSDDYAKRYLINLHAQSVPVDHLEFRFFAYTNAKLRNLRDLPESIPIQINLDSMSEDMIDLSLHPWLDENRICEVTGRDRHMPTFKIPPKVTSLDTNKLDEDILKFRHQLESIIICDNCLDNLKYFDHLSRLDIHLSNEYEDSKKIFCDNLESFLLGNGKTVTHFSFSAPEYYDDFLPKIASMNRDIKWRYLYLLARIDKQNVLFKENHLNISFDGALNWVSETLSLASNCHRLRVISITDEHICKKYVGGFYHSKKFSANVKYNQLQSWKSMMKTFASDKKNSKIDLELFVDNPDEDNIISGDNWTITQVKAPKREYSIHEWEYFPTLRAVNLWLEMFQVNSFPYFS